MLRTCFYFLINMSISGSVIIIFLLVLRRIRIVPKRFIYALWLAALLRMSLPFAISSSFSVFNFFSDLIKKNIPVGKLFETDLTTSNYFNAALAYTPMEYKTQRLKEVFNTGTVVWGFGAFIALLVVCALYCTVFYQYKNSIRLKDNVYVNSKAVSPFLLGIRIPKIILPIGIDADSVQASYIIAHENVHIRRGDNLWRLIGLVVTCIHWFNPFAWVGFTYFLKDMELSCDEAAINKYDLGKRKEYANTLLTIAENSQGQNPISVAFGNSNTEKRVVRVLSYKGLSLFGTMISISFLLIMATMLLTNPKI